MDPSEREALENLTLTPKKEKPAEMFIKQTEPNNLAYFNIYILCNTFACDV